MGDDDEDAGRLFPEEAGKYYVDKHFEIIECCVVKHFGNWSDSGKDPVQVWLSLRQDAINAIKEELRRLDPWDETGKIEAGELPYLEISSLPR
jgi:hypothetical protein